jgi:hypothetical protein
LGKACQEHAKEDGKIAAGTIRHWYGVDKGWSVAENSATDSEPLPIYQKKAWSKIANRMESLSQYMFEPCEMNPERNGSTSKKVYPKMDTLNPSKVPPKMGSLLPAQTNKKNKIFFESHTAWQRY